MRKLLKKEWWKQEERGITLLKAVLLALLPGLCCLVRCAAEGRTIGEVWLPACDWNDELFYYKQVEGIIRYGYPQGYFGFNESHALKLSFAAWSPVLVFPWVLWGLLFGWNLLSPVICNILLLTLACFLFVLLVRPTWKQLGILTLLFCLYTPFTRYLLSGMPEIICFSMLILFYGLAFGYSDRERVYKLVLMFVLAAVMTLMRPYLLLFLLLPAYFWIRRDRVRGTLGSAGIFLVTLAAYACIKHYLGAEYFAPLFFTDWLEAFFEQGVSGGFRVLFGTLYYKGTDALRYMLQGWKTGLAPGAYFDGYLVLLVILLGQSAAELRRRRRRRAAGDAGGAEASGRRLILQLHLAFSCIAMLFAVLLMYKLIEGSKHLLTFMAAGVFVVAMMETRFYKKAALLGATFLYLYNLQATDPGYYAVPYVQEEAAAEYDYWERTFRERLVLDREGETPDFDNTVIWVLNDAYPDGSSGTVAWQYLYALPEGFGISCCQREYVLEHFDMLQSGYIATLSGGEIEEKCLEAGLEEIGRTETLAVYRLAPYDGVFVSMHSLENYAEEDFLEFRGIRTLFFKDEADGVEEILSCLQETVGADTRIRTVFLELDPEKLRRDSGEKDAGSKEQPEEWLLSAAGECPEVTFEILLSAPSLEYWLSMTEEETETALQAYLETAEKLSEAPNIRLFFFGAEYWLIANQDNYAEKSFTKNREISRKLFLYAFCDGEYRLTEENAEAVIGELRELIGKERVSPTAYPDLSGCDIAYFGDSILNYVTDSSSVSGCVSAFSGASAVDCSESGTAATDAFEDTVDRFLREDDGIVKNGVSIGEFSASDRQKVFVINYGLNDYFNGVPTDGREASYAGALCSGIRKLLTAFPEAVVLLMTPTYSGAFEGGTQIMGEEAGELTDYVDAAMKVAEELNVYCLDNYHTLGLNQDTLGQYTTDLVHLNEYGRLALAQHIMEKLDEIVKNQDF